MRLPTLVIISLFSLCAAVGPLYAQEDAASELVVITSQSLVPDIRNGYTRCNMTLDGVIEYCDQGAIRIITIVIADSNADAGLINEIADAYNRRGFGFVEMAAEQAGADPVLTADALTSSAYQYVKVEGGDHNTYKLLFNKNWPQFVNIRFHPYATPHDDIEFPTDVMFITDRLNYDMRLSADQ